MEFFRPDTTVAERKTASQYLIGKLLRAKFEDLVALVTGVRTRYLAAHRTLEDAADPVGLAIAQRDAIDDELDDMVKDQTARLRGRSATAAAERPYKDVVPKGVDDLTTATIAETPAKYTEYVERITTFLPEGDAVRVEAAAEIPPRIADFTAAQERVKEALRNQALRQTDFDGAEAELDRTYERVAGVLIERVGKKKADRFFRRISTRRAKKPVDE